MCTFFVLFFSPQLACVSARAEQQSQSSLSHAEQRGNLEPSGRRHPSVADTAGKVWEGRWEPEGLVWSVYFFPLNSLLNAFFFKK